MENEQIWQAVLGELEVNLSRANFTTWFKNTSILLIAPDEVVVGVPNAFTKEWLENKYHNDIVNALRDVTKKDIKGVVYKVKSSPAEKEDVAIIEKVVAPKEEPVQESTLNPKHTFETFIVGEGNKLAHAAGESVSANPGKSYNPLFLYGGVGLGKTHLVQAIGNKIVQNFPDKKVLYVPSERFVNEFIESIGSKRTNDFKNKYRQVDVLIIDDIQFLASKERTQEEFFHTFNDLHNANRQIILSSDRPPKAINTLEERIRSRFEWGMLADIQFPDLETRIAILNSKCEQRGYEMPQDVTEYVAENIKHNIRELEGALTRIIAYCELNDEPPSLETARAVLANILTSPKNRAVKPKSIIDAVVSFYDLRAKDLLGKNRSKEFSLPRQITMYLLREELSESYPRIADLIGGRDHTTIMHGCKKIEEEIKNNETLQHEINLIREQIYGSGA